MLADWRIWALGSALFAGATAILAKVGVQGVDSNLATAIRTAVILIFSWALVIATGQGSRLSSLTPRTWLFLCLSGLATGLSWLCYFRALQLGEASRVVPIDKFSVVFAIALAAVFLGEKLSWHQWLGGALILAGAIVIALKPG
jgi:transporter family protein